MMLTTRTLSRRRTGAVAARNVPLALALALAACSETLPTDSASSASSSAAASIPSAVATSAASASAGASVAAPAEDLVTGLEAAGVDSASGVNELHAFHHGGLTEFVSVALDTLGVEPARQARVEAIQHDLDLATAPARAAESALLVALASGVEAGKLDSHAVDAALARFSAAVAARAPTVDPMNKLHALLTPVERSALVDKVIAHWEVSGDANADEREGKGRLAMLTEELGLSPAQVTQIKAELHAAKGLATSESEATLTKEFDTRVRSFGDGFAGDPYDAKGLKVGDMADTHLAAARATRMARFFEIAAPVLTPGQRTDVAGRLRACASDPVTPSPK